MRLRLPVLVDRRHGISRACWRLERQLTIFALDLLTELQSLSPATLGGILAVGLALWLTGWWAHRFWITLLTSFAAGVVGLKVGPQYGVEQPIIAGLLLAVAGGALALALARLG